MTRYIDFTTGNDLLDEGIENYLMYGFKPGGFLSAVLSNNLFLAARRADHSNKQRLAQIAVTIYHNMPADSFGNEKIVKDWLADKDNRRTEYAQFKEREFTFKSLKGEVCEKVFPDVPF